MVTKPNSPPKPHINCSPSPKASHFPPKVTAVKAPMVNAAKGVQGKWEWKPKCLILTIFPNTDGDVAFDEKKHEFEGRKPESEVNVSSSSSAQSKKHDDKTK
nr:hypothetical protein [Tanacetum cinerariifolium]